MIHIYLSQYLKYTVLSQKSEKSIRYCSYGTNYKFSRTEEMQSL
jgi:hypothetical protein